MSDAIRPGGDVNWLELVCTGDTITWLANGVQLASFRDTANRSGRARFDAVITGETPLPDDVRFDNLAISEQ